MLVTVDTGGTKTLIASFNEAGEMGEVIKFPTPRDQSEYIKQLRAVLKEHYEVTDIDALVIALPGSISNNHILVSAHNLGWHDLDLKSVLKEDFSFPILIENDANLAGLAAARQLDEPVQLCLYVTVSTGIGTGLIVDNLISEDYKRSQGGSIVLEYNGELMRWEDFASGQAIKNEYGMYASEIDDPKIWAEIADKLSRGFLVLLPLLRPDVVVIGGSIGTYFDLYKDELIKRLTGRMRVVPPITAARHPEQAVVYGCYYYALDYLSGR